MMYVSDVLYEWYCRVVCRIADMYEWGKEHVEEPTEYFQDLADCTIEARFECKDDDNQPLTLKTSDVSFSKGDYSVMSSYDRELISYTIGDWMSDAIKTYNKEKREENEEWVDLDEEKDFRGTLHLTVKFEELVTHCSSFSLFYFLILSFLLSFAL
jgi:hypothetical protein